MATKKKEADAPPAETRDIAPIAPDAELVDHPLAGLFPMLAGAEESEFNQDVRNVGVNVKVTLFKGQLLDGRNRRRAARLAGQFCPAEEYIGKDPLRFVMSRNVRRRHLTESQRAAAAAEAEGFTHGGARRGEAAKDEKPATREEVAAMANVSVPTVARAARVKNKGTPELFNAVREGLIPANVAAQAVNLKPEEQKQVIAEVSAGRATSAKQVIKRGRVKERNEKIKNKILKLPDRQFAVFYEDPEWEHETWSELGQDRSATMHYDVSKFEAILNRDISKICFPKAALYIWVTVPHLPLVFQVIEKRGFTYRSNFVWHKKYPGTKTGLGYWARIEHEHLIIATRGDIPCPAPGDNRRSVIQSNVGEHSEKPEWAYELIEEYHGDLCGHWIELNARRRRRGWSAWGREIGCVTPSVEQLQAEFKANELINERIPENPDMRALFYIHTRRAELVDKADMKRVVKAGFVLTSGDKPKLSANGKRELSEWAEREAEAEAEAEPKKEPTKKEKAEAAACNDGIPDFLLRQAKA